MTGRERSAQRLVERQCEGLALLAELEQDPLVRSHPRLHRLVLEGIALIRLANNEACRALFPRDHLDDLKAA